MLSMTGITFFENGKFVKIMFFAFSLFFGVIIGYELYKGVSNFSEILITAMLVFFSLTGRTMVEAYSNKSDLAYGVKPE